jgi:hypothetical protein
VISDSPPLSRVDIKIKLAADFFGRGFPKQAKDPSHQELINPKHCHSQPNAQDDPDHEVMWMRISPIPTLALFGDKRFAPSNAVLLNLPV